MTLRFAGWFALSVLGVLPASMAMAQSRSSTPQTVNTPPPRADQPIMENIERPPVLALEAGAGVLGFVAGAAGLGPVWNARVTANVTARWAVEANYLGAVNERSDTNTALLMSAADASLRYNLLRGYQAPVQPFVTGGFGYAAFGGTRGDLFTLTTPVAAGVERMFTRTIKGGARFEYRPAFFDHLGSPGQDLEKQPGADTWALLAHLGGAF